MNINDILFKIYPANIYQTKIEAFNEGKKIGGLLVDAKLKDLDNNGINMFKLEVIRNILEERGGNMKTIIIDNKEFEISEESYEAFKKQFVKDDKRWKPEHDEKYYYIGGCADWHADWWNDKYDNFRYINKNVYKTKAECERALEILNILNQYSYDFSEEEWENYDIKKHYLFYDFDDAEIGYCYIYHFKLASRHFKDKETAKKVAKLIGKEDYKKYITFGGIK